MFYFSNFNLKLKKAFYHWSIQVEVNIGLNSMMQELELEKESI